MKAQEFRDTCNSFSSDVYKLLGRVDVSEDRTLTDLEYRTIDKISAFLSFLSDEITWMKDERD